MKYLTSLLTGLLAAILLTVSVRAIAGNTGDDLPIDPKVIKGKLDNGLTYYIRHNEVPENRAEFYLFVDAGAVLEEPDQNGLAHFCEHMAFNGTKNFPKKGVLDYMESIGVKFGHNVNAFTSYDKTVYNLAQVPVNRESVIDSTLLVLHDWASQVSYEAEEIDKERGVIHEEWRTRRGPQFRMRLETSKVLFKGSKYAEHDIIGKLDVIDNCEYETLRSFYDDWYRPDLQAIAVVGDIDEKQIEKKIKDLFGKIQTPEKQRERYVEDIPDNVDPLIAIVSDPEATQSQVKVLFKHDAETTKDLDYFKQSYRQQLYNMMMNDRLQELTQKEDPPFIGGYTYYGGMVRSTNAYQSIAIAKNSQLERALETLLEENKRIKQFGFTQSELERNKKEMLSNLEKQYANRDKKKSRNYIWGYMNNFMKNEPIPGIAFEYKTAKKELPEITVDELNALAKKWITDKNMVVTISAVEKEGIAIPAKDDVKAIIDKVEKGKIEPYEDEVVDNPLISNLPETGKVAGTKKDDALGLIEYTLNNGMKVIIKPTGFKENEILMEAYSSGGNSLSDEESYLSGRIYSTVMRYNGVGDFGMTALKKKLAGKNVSVNPYVDDLREGLTGNCESDDFETMLKLSHLYFQPAREDEKAFNAIMNRYKAVLSNKSADPRFVFSDSVQYVMAGHNPLKEPLSSKLLEKVNYDDLLELHNNRFKDASDFTFFFVGNIDPKKSKPLIEKYLGSIEDIQRAEKWKNLGVHPPKGEYKTRIKKNMKVPKSSVFVNFNGPIDYDYPNRMQMRAIDHILELRYTETIREEQGGSYGVGVRQKVEEYPESRFSLSISFDCDPGKQEELMEIVYDEVKKLYTEGPSQEDLKKAKEYFLKTREENLRENKYWLNALVHNRFHNENILNEKNYEAIVKALTTDDIRQAAEKYLKNANTAEIVMNPVNESAK